eukprot:CAMPEP_0179349070 /NCGR_PEP_ID=MMETSP0797-20121207/74044_1 /TAXON_ID=47934 /ORGANISM="Dinophysis acuminata, Strain DAEP01" /LENGTH=343 /DNA_ID=CAMNT_0021063927 /DNA_START=93 /DNA_END=1120 /DNA_ORIENTATION=-
MRPRLLPLNAFAPMPVSPLRLFAIGPGDSLAVTIPAAGRPGRRYTRRGGSQGRSRGSPRANLLVPEAGDLLPPAVLQLPRRAQVAVPALRPSVAGYCAVPPGADGELNAAALGARRVKRSEHSPVLVSGCHDVRVYDVGPELRLRRSSARVVSPDDGRRDVAGRRRYVRGEAGRRPHGVVVVPDAETIGGETREGVGVAGPAARGGCQEALEEDREAGRVGAGRRRGAHLVGVVLPVLRVPAALVSARRAAVASTGLVRQLPERVRRRRPGEPRPAGLGALVHGVCASIGCDSDERVLHDDLEPGSRGVRKQRQPRNEVRALGRRLRQAVAAGCGHLVSTAVG